MDVRARVLETPLKVAFRETRTASGQVCIALDSDSDSERELVVEADYEYDDDEDGEELQSFDAPPWPTQPTVLTIDSDDEDVEQQEILMTAPDVKPMKSDPELLVSLERTQPPDRPSRATPLPSLDEVQDVEPVREDGSRRMDETDAAFLLFYGVRETPSVNTLRLIIGTSQASPVICMGGCLTLCVSVCNRTDSERRGLEQLVREPQHRACALGPPERAGRRGAGVRAQGAVGMDAHRVRRAEGAVHLFTAAQAHGASVAAASTARDHAAPARADQTSGHTPPQPQEATSATSQRPQWRQCSQNRA